MRRLRTKASAGAKCSVTDSECAVGLSCPNGTCAKEGAIGDACDSNSNFCRDSLFCEKGTCAIGPQIGAACGGPQGIGCDNTSAANCDLDTKICVQLKVGKPGDACGVNVPGPHVECGGADGGICSDMGTCAPPSPIGAACSSSTHPHCESGAGCVNGICTILDPASCK